MVPCLSFLFASSGNQFWVIKRNYWKDTQNQWEMDNSVCEQVETTHLRNWEAKLLPHNMLNLVGVRTVVAMDDVQSFLLTLHHWFKECPNDALCFSMCWGKKKKISFHGFLNPWNYHFSGLHMVG